MNHRFADIISVGSYLPDRVVTNADLESLVDTTDEWITTRTGIRERRMVTDETTSDLATVAARRALDRAGIDDADVDLLIVGTSTPDHIFPSTACVTQAKLGLSCPAFDVLAACTSFIYALEAGAAAIESGRAQTVVIVGADAVTRVVDFTDRSTCVLFGDGAGAVVLQAAEEAGVESVILGADGAGADLLKVEMGGAAMLCSEEGARERRQFLTMAGNDVFKFAVRVIPRATLQALEMSGHKVEDLTWLIPHQANQRILDTIEERLGIEHARVFSNLARTGNTSAASIPLALDELYTDRRLNRGDLLGMVGFGAGLTWGAAIVRWTLPQPDSEM